VPNACQQGSQLGSHGSADIVAAPLPGDLALTEAIEYSVGATAHSVNNVRHPAPAMMSARAAVSWSTVRATKDKQVMTQAQATAEAQAAAVGCTTPFKDMISIDASFRIPASSPSGILGRPHTGLNLCRYAASKGPGGMPLLTFISGRRGSGIAAATLSSAPIASGPVQPYQLPHTTVTGIFTTASDWLLVEDDCCHRVLDGGNNSWGQPTPALLASLHGARRETQARRPGELSERLSRVLKKSGNPGTGFTSGQLVNFALSRPEFRYASVDTPTRRAA
jgi:hypothetical protein